MRKLMYRITRSFRFAALIKPVSSNGRCQLRHKRYLMSVTVEGEELITTEPKKGMLLDYDDITLAVSTTIERYLDNHYIDKTTGLDNLTLEALSEWIYWMIEPRILDIRKDESIKIVSVSVGDTMNTSCTFSPPEPRTSRRGLVWAAVSEMLQKAED